MTAIKTLIVDDQALFRQAIHLLLEPETDIDVVGTAANGEEALHLIRELKPQVVLMDLMMPTMGGTEATRRICAEHPHTRVLVLTTFDDGEEVFEALRSGASGYVLKNITSPHLVEGIKAVATGGTYLQPSIASQVVQEFTRLSQISAGRTRSLRVLSALSLREHEILRQLMQGKSNKEIASALDITEGTVKNHMSSILEKLQVQDRTAAALKARDLGLG